jgi:hypothetical protein
MRGRQADVGEGELERVDEWLERTAGGTGRTFKLSAVAADQTGCAGHRGHMIVASPWGVVQRQDIRFWS